MKLRWTLEKIEDILKNYKWSVDSKEDNIYKISIKSEKSELKTFLTVSIKSTTIDILSREGGWKGIKGYEELEKAINSYTLKSKIKR